METNRSEDKVLLTGPLLHRLSITELITTLKKPVDKRTSTLALPHTFLCFPEIVTQVLFKLYSKKRDVYFLNFK